MHFKQRKIIMLITLLLLLVALPTSTVLANKQIFKAKLATSSELHEVVGSSASGSAVVGFNQDGTLRFQVYVRNLSGAPTGAHIHAIASESENAGVVVTLCGNGPGNAVLSTCTFSDGALFIQGTISGGNLTGISGGDFINALRDGLTYVNVHTELNPMGEVRGQLIQQ